MEPDYNSAFDFDWRGEPEDFNCSGVLATSSPPNSFIEEPLEEVGMYDEIEDRRNWSF